LDPKLVNLPAVGPQLAQHILICGATMTIETYPLADELVLPIQITERFILNYYQITIRHPSLQHAEPIG